VRHALCARFSTASRSVELGEQTCSGQEASAALAPPERGCAGAQQMSWHWHTLKIRFKLAQLFLHRLVRLR
jgi:hypothetical protein